MRGDLAIAVGGGCGGMLGWGLADFFAKQTIDRVGDIASLVWGHVAGTAVLATVALLYLGLSGGTSGLPGDAGSILLLCLFGAAQASVYLLVYSGFGKGQVSVLSPLFASYSGVAALLSIAVLGEAVGVARVGMLGLMFLGVLLASVEPGPSTNARRGIAAAPGVREVLAAAALAAAWTVAWDSLISGHAWLAYTAVMYAAMTLTIVAFAIGRRVSLPIPRGSTLTLLCGIGIAEVVAYLGIGAGFSASSETSLVAILSGAFAIPTVLLARMFLSERVRPWQGAGVAALMLGAMALPIT